MRRGGNDGPRGAHLPVRPRYFRSSRGSGSFSIAYHGASSATGFSHRMYGFSDPQAQTFAWTALPAVFCESYGVVTAVVSLADNGAGEG